MSKSCFGRLLRKLHKLGGRPIAPPETFYVSQRSAIRGRSRSGSSLGRFPVSNFTNPHDADASSLDGLDLQRPPLVVGNDIAHYDLAAHEIELTEEAFGQIVSLFALPVDTDGIPFVVAVSGEPIYSGAFYTPASSISYDGVVILEPLSGNPNTISIRLGYPGLEAFDGEDPRSDPRIIAAAQSFQR